MSYPKPLFGMTIAELALCRLRAYSYYQFTTLQVAMVDSTLRVLTERYLLPQLRGEGCLRLPQTCPLQLYGIRRRLSLQNVPACRHMRLCALTKRQLSAIVGVIYIYIMYRYMYEYVTVVALGLSGINMPHLNDIAFVNSVILQEPTEVCMRHRYTSDIIGAQLYSLHH